MVGHGGSSAGLYLADPTSPIQSHCTLIVATSTLRVKIYICSKFPKNVICSLWLFQYSQVSCMLTLKVLVATIDAQWEGMGDVGSARYEPGVG